MKLSKKLDRMPFFGDILVFSYCSLTVTNRSLFFGFSGIHLSLGSDVSFIFLFLHFSQKDSYVAAVSEQRIAREVVRVEAPSSTTSTLCMVFAV